MNGRIHGINVANAVPFPKLYKRIQLESFSGVIQIEEDGSESSRYFLVLKRGCLIYIGKSFSKPIEFLRLFSQCEESKLYPAIRDYALGGRTTVADAIKLLIKTNTIDKNLLYDVLFEHYQEAIAPLRTCSFRVTIAIPPDYFNLSSVWDGIEIASLLRATRSTKKPAAIVKSSVNLPKILHVDDRKVQRLLVRKFLDGCYDVSSYEKAEEVIAALLGPDRFDLVLLDYELPDMSGIDLCVTIRSFEVYQNIPIVMLTARGGIMDRLRGMRVGANKYLVKPFTKTKLRAAIKETLESVQS